MFNIKTKDKQKAIEDILLEKNSTLEKENLELKAQVKCLQKSADDLNKLKAEYETLIAETKDMQNKYKEKINVFTELETEYRKRLEELVRK